MANDPLALDVEVARKTGMNSDIVRLCSRNLSPDSDPTLVGIGLYTHIAQPKESVKDHSSASVDKHSQRVRFIPLGGYNRVQPSKLHQPDKEVAAIYKELQEAIEAEAKIWNDHKTVDDKQDEISLTALKKKYGDPYEMPSEGPVVHPSVRNQTKRKHSEMKGGKDNEPSQKRRVSFAPLLESRRLSLGSVAMSDRDADPAMPKSGSRNKYDISRDPRRRSSWAGQAG